MDICSVCLSPLKTEQSKSLVETKCKHTFHEQCLSNARCWKSECPMCRCALSPLMQQLQNILEHNSRELIIRAANRGRNAVRNAMMQRSEITSLPIGVNS